jgi:hypothetical protein
MRQKKEVAAFRLFIDSIMERRGGLGCFACGCEFALASKVTDTLSSPCILRTCAPLPIWRAHALEISYPNLCNHNELLVQNVKKPRASITTNAEYNKIYPILLNLSVFKVQSTQ